MLASSQRGQYVIPALVVRRSVFVPVAALMTTAWVPGMTAPEGSVTVLNGSGPGDLGMERTRNDQQARREATQKPRASRVE